MSVFLNNNKKGNMTVEFNLNKENKVNNKTGDNMARFNENKVVEVDVEMKNNKDKIIGYNTYYYCSKCGTEVKEDHKYCSECGEHLIEEKGDKMEWNLINVEEIDNMSIEELGTIAITQKEEEEFEFENEYQVLMKLLDLGFDFTKTNIFKEVKDEWFKTSVNEAEYLFDDLLTELVTNCDEIIFEEPRNIIIEEIVVDCSFDYDYGSISSTHTEWGTIGYNVFVEDIE